MPVGLATERLVAAFKRTLLSLCCKLERMEALAVAREGDSAMTVVLLDFGESAEQVYNCSSLLRLVASQPSVVAALLFWQEVDIIYPMTEILFFCSTIMSVLVLRFRYAL